MGYYRSGDVPAPAVPDIGYSDADWPDPLAGGPTRARRLIEAYQRWRDSKTKETEMGYYRAGDGGSFGVLMSDQNQAGAIQTYVTPALATWRAKHPGQDYPERVGGRRMNIGNVRALRRSMRRVLGFAHMAKKVMTFTAHHKMKKRKGRR